MMKTYTKRLFLVCGILSIVFVSLLTGCEDRDKPALGGTVSIDGTVRVARVVETLTANTNGLTGKGRTLQYQWKVGADNVGTDAKTYTPTAEDVGKAITVTVTSSGNTGSVTSDPTGSVVSEEENKPNSGAEEKKAEGTEKRFADGLSQSVSFLMVAIGISILIFAMSAVFCRITEPKSLKFKIVCLIVFILISTVIVPLFVLFWRLLGICL